jgi:hypothetical protein
MNKEYEFIYTCSDIIRLWSGTIKIIDQDNPNIKKDVINYLETKYKYSDCKVYNQKEKNTNEEKGISFNQKDIFLTSVFYK